MTDFYRIKVINMFIKTGCILAVGICLSLTACSTTHTTNTNNNSTEDKKANAAQINTRLGLAYLERHDVQRAKQKLLIALDEGPNLPEPWYAMGYLLQATGNTDQAKKYYLKAVELAPDRGDVLNNYGTFLCRSGDYNGAIKQFLTAVKDPKYINTASAYENAGLCALKIPDRTMAMGYFNKALNEDPMRATSLIELAQLDYQKGNLELAKHHLEQYLQVAAPNEQSYELEKRIYSKL